MVEKNGALDVGFVSEDCNDSFDPHLLFQKSTNGGASFLPHAVRIDKPGQYADFLDAAKDDTLPPTAFRAPNTPSLAYSPRTGTLLYVYQNNINRPVSGADISYQTVPGRWPALVGREVPEHRGGPDARPATTSSSPGPPLTRTACSR